MTTIVKLYPYSEQIAALKALFESGSVPIADSAVTNAKLADMAQATVKGRAAGAGTGIVTDLTGAQLRAIINVADGATANNDIASIPGLEDALALKADTTALETETDARKVGDASSASMVETEFIDRAGLIRRGEGGGVQIGNEREQVEEFLPRTSYALEINDQILLRADDQGFVEIEPEREDVPGVLRATLAQDGNTIIAATREDETFAALTPALPRAQKGLRAGLCHILGIGQSWMGGTGGAPALTTVAQDRVLMFVGGIRPLDTLTAPAAYASLVGAVESNNTGDVRGETPLSGFARTLVERVAADDGYTLADAGSNMLLSVVAPGGTSVTAFAKGGTYFIQMMDHIDAGIARADDLGTTYRLLCCPIIMGKGDYDLYDVSQQAWEINLGTLCDDINAAIRERVPDHPDVHFIVIQSGSHGYLDRAPTVDLAINALDRSHPLIWYGGVLYPYVRASDGVHFTGASYRHAGAVAGLIAKMLAVDGTEPKAMLPVEYQAQGKAISVMFDPAADLTLDDAAVDDPVDHGFELVDGEGAALTISSVTAYRDRIDIVASEILPDAWSLRYAWSGAYVGSTVSGPRGSLRDKQGDTIEFDPTGLAIPLHNWAGLFEIVHEGV